MDTASVLGLGRFARNVVARFAIFLWTLPLTGAFLAARAPASVCTFAGAGGTLTAIELPEGRVHYRSAVVPARDFAVSECVTAGLNSELYCGVAQIFRPLGESLFDIAGSRGEEAFPTTAFIFDPQLGRRTHTLPFRVLQWSYHAGRDLLAASDGALVHLYSPGAGRLQGQLFVDGQPVSLAFDDDGSALFVVYFPEDSEGLAVAEVNVDTGRTQRTMPFPTGYAPWTFVKPPGRRLGYSARYSTALPTGDRTLVVLDLERFEVARVLNLPGEVRAMQPREDGSALYVSYVTSEGPGIALIAIPEDRILASVATEGVAYSFGTNGEEGWIVALSLSVSGTTNMTGWTADLSQQLFRHSYPYLSAGRRLLLARGPCPPVDACAADCNADGRVSVDEVVRAGRLRGSWGAAGVSGEFTVPDGSLFTWELRTVRAKREKVAPPRASALLARGQPATVVVGLDIYPALREGRARTNALAHRRWDNVQAIEAFYTKLAELRGAFVAYANRHADISVIEALAGSATVSVRVNTRDGLAHLLSAENVRVVDDERVYRVALAESLPLIGQPSASRLGLNGRGVDIGVIDTGVDHLLRDASGRLVFGDGCLDGVGAPGCVIKCAVRHSNGYPDRRDEPNLHGTTVSGIASSVASGAGLCVSDVWDEVAADNGRQALTRSNIARALDWFVDLKVRGVHNIRVLNMSLSAVPSVFLPSAPPAYCSDIELQSEIFALLYLDVAIVAATGNEGRTNWVDIPSCMRGVIRVGATYDESFTGTMTWSNGCSDVNPSMDSIACFSNGWSLPLVLAPGALIRFADRAPAGGTSFATPHVAGAIAALRGEGPFAPDDTECITARLIKTGAPVLDARPNINRAFPRIDLGAAAATLPNSTGDCNGDGRVGTTDLELGVAIALGQVGIAQCPRFDARQDGQVTIDELVAAVNVSLYRCAVGPSGYA